MEELNSINLVKVKHFIEREIDILDGNLYWILIIELNDLISEIYRISKIYNDI